jgi:hypothetical protein
MTDPTHTNYAQAWMEAHAEKVLGRKEPETVQEGYQREAIKHMRDEGRFSGAPKRQWIDPPERQWIDPPERQWIDPPELQWIDPPELAAALAKSLAIKLAVRELEKLPGAYKLHYPHGGTDWEAVECESRKIISNLLIGLGCEAVVDAWNEVG